MLKKTQSNFLQQYFKNKSITWNDWVFFSFRGSSVQFIKSSNIATFSSNSFDPLIMDVTKDDKRASTENVEAAESTQQDTQNNEPQLGEISRTARIKDWILWHDSSLIQ